jgi:uncharacterized membrane protein
MHNWLYGVFTSGKIDDLDNRTKGLIRFLFYSCIFIIFLIAVLLIVNFVGHESSEKPYLGTFGDFFGGVLNPILGFFTVIGLAVTVVMQRISLKASRLIAFENTFFNMLELHNNIVQQLRFDPAIIPQFRDDSVVIGKTSRDKSLLHSVKKALISLLRSPTSSAHDEKIYHVHEGRAVFFEILEALERATGTEKDLSIAYEHDLQNKHNYVLGHYFRNLYQILKHISRGEQYVLTLTQAKEYSAIVRSQLSSHELVLLLLNCLPKVVDNGAFLKLVVRYRMLEHLPLLTSPDNKSISLLDYSVDINYIRRFFQRRKTTRDEEANTKKIRVTLPGAYGTNPHVRKYLVETQPGLFPYNSKIEFVEQPF